MDDLSELRLRLARVVSAPQVGAVSALLFWRRTFGALATSVSLFSLLVTYCDLGLTGVASLVHEQFALLRDVIFDSLERVIPYHVSPNSRAFIIASAMFIAVFARTHQVVRGNGWTLFRTIYFGIFVPLIIVLGAAAIGLVIVTGSWDRLLETRSSLVIGATIGAAIGFNAEESAAFWVLIQNAAFSVAVALGFLMLGGAF